MFDIISIGDATLDTFIDLETAEVKCKPNSEDCWLCLDFAEKIPIYHFDRKVAGNAANNAVGSSRLGMKAAFWTILGNDNTGRLVRNTMIKEGVSDRFVQIREKSESNFTVVLNYQGERTQLVYRHPRKYKLPKLNKTQWIYLTAMAKEHVLITDPLVDYIKQKQVRLAYNPGKEQIICNIEDCAHLLDVTTVLFVNKKEAQSLLRSRATNIKTLMKKLRNLGPEIIVITDGPHGSYSFDGTAMYWCDIYPAELVERTGAGDAYATAFVGALHYNRAIEEAMIWGTINSAAVIGKIGPQDGLLTRTQIEYREKHKPFLKVKKL